MIKVSVGTRSFYYSTEDKARRNIIRYIMKHGLLTSMVNAKVDRAILREISKGNDDLGFIEQWNKSSFVSSKINFETIVVDKEY